MASVPSARDDHGPSPETGISSWCHSSLCHSTDLKDRSRSEQSSNRDSPQYGCHSEQLQLRGICCWVFAERLNQANRRSHPVHLHLLVWRGRPRPRLHLQLLVWHGRLARVQEKGFQVAPGSPPDSNESMGQCVNHPIGKVCLRNRATRNQLKPRAIKNKKINGR